MKHRYLLAHPAFEVRAREHAAQLEESEPDVTYEVALRADCPPHMMFVLHYLPRLTWLKDVVLDGPEEAR